MFGKHELSVFIDEGGNAASVLYDIQEMGVIQPQQGTNQDFVYHTMSYQDHRSRVSNNNLVNQTGNPFPDTSPIRSPS